jgi:hypothetical protein
LARVWAAMEELDESKIIDRKAENAMRAIFEFAGTRERCFICPNDILEREFRTFIVSG